MTDTTSPPSTLPLAPGAWALDTHHSSVGFTIRHLGISKVRGVFGEFTADVVVGETLADTSVNATIAVASIDTGNADRDAHVLSSDLVDVAARPTLAFRSTDIAGGGDDWTLTGDLTIGEVTRPISLAVDFGGVQAFPDGTRHAGFEATGELRRKDYGLSFGPADALLGDVVKITLDLQLIEPA